MKSSVVVVVVVVVDGIVSLLKYLSSSWMSLLILLKDVLRLLLVDRFKPTPLPKFINA